MKVIEMASFGAKMLQIRSVEMAIKASSEIKVQVLSSFTDESGSLLVKHEKNGKRLITAIANMKDEARITIQNVDNKPGIVAGF